MVSITILNYQRVQGTHCVYSSKASLNDLATVDEEYELQAFAGMPQNERILVLLSRLVMSTMC